MKSTDKQRFARTMAAMCELYQRDISEMLMDLYIGGLSEYPIAAIEHAFGVHARNPESGRFFPKIADIVGIIDGSATDRAATAWSKVLRGVAEAGQYDSLVFDDALIHAVLSDMGGFALVCMANVDEIPFKARDFEARYRSYASRGATPPYPPKIVGITEAENRSRGLTQFIPKPVFIGDPATCQAVESRGRALQQAEGATVLKLVRSGL